MQFLKLLVALFLQHVVCNRTLFLTIIIKLGYNFAHYIS